jgi:hypothetical protein
MIEDIHKWGVRFSFDAYFLRLLQECKLLFSSYRCYGALVILSVCMTPTIVNGKRNGVFWGNEMVHKLSMTVEIDYSVIPMSGIQELYARPMDWLLSVFIKNRTG